MICIFLWQQALLTYSEAEKDKFCELLTQNNFQYKLKTKNRIKNNSDSSESSSSFSHEYRVFVEKKNYEKICDLLGY